MYTFTQKVSKTATLYIITALHINGCPLTFDVCGWLTLDQMDFLHTLWVWPWFLIGKCQKVMLVCIHAMHPGTITMPQSLFWWM